MPLMLAEVANVAFSQPSLGMGGYDADEVDAFLDSVEAELAGLIQENTDLRNRVEPLSEQLPAGEPTTAGLDRPDRRIQQPDHVKAADQLGHRHWGQRRIRRADPHLFADSGLSAALERAGRPT